MNIQTKDKEKNDRKFLPDRRHSSEWEFANHDGRLFGTGGYVHIPKRKETILSIFSTGEKSVHFQFVLDVIGEGWVRTYEDVKFIGGVKTGNFRFNRYLGGTSSCENYEDLRSGPNKIEVISRRLMFPMRAMKNAWTPGNQTYAVELIFAPNTSYMGTYECNHATNVSYYLKWFQDRDKE